MADRIFLAIAILMIPPGIFFVVTDVASARVSTGGIDAICVIALAIMGADSFRNLRNRRLSGTYRREGR